MIAQQNPRPRRAATALVRRLAFWLSRGLSRAAVALVFMLGMLATAGTTQIVSERDLVAERGEDTEGTGQASFHVQAPRRVRTGAAPLARHIESPSAPRLLEPRRSVAPRRSWQHPRRSVPPDDEDDEDDEALC